MTKRKDDQKEHDIKRTPNRKVSHGFRRNRIKRKKKMRNKERLGLLGDGHKASSGTQGAKHGNQWFPRTLDSHYKKGGKQ